MHCPTCQHENRATARFCLGCGYRFSVACARCGKHLPGEARFCDECGATVETAQSPLPHPLPGGEGIGKGEPPLPQGAEEERSLSLTRGRGAGAFRSDPPRAYTPKHLADKILQSKSALEGERKHVTVLFADVKGSMELAEQVDPEEWHRILDGFFQILTEGVHRFEGTVNQYTGDGIMALFGAPIMHEDHAQRACFAALQLAGDLQQYASGLKRERGLQFAVRMGINSGDVVVASIGDDLRMDYTALGHTVGLAQRMEQLADPGKAYMTDATAKLVAGYFELADLGSFTVKGVSEPIVVHELRGQGRARTRLDVSRARGLTRFVGRGDEMQVLERALDRAMQGDAQVLGLVADAGVGKSRLCWEFIERCRGRGITVYEGHGVPHGKAVPLLPVLEYLRGYFGIGEQDAEQTVREKVAGKVLLLDSQLADALPLLFDFLGVPDPARPVARMDPDARQRQLLQCLAQLLKADAQRQPVCSLVEDLHWLDASSEAFVQGLVEGLPGTRTLVLVNFRPEYHADWTQKSYYQRVALTPLGPEAIAELLGDLLGADPSVAGLAGLIQERTAGNAFFIEEVVQGLIEDGSLDGARGAYRLARPVGQLRVPPTVRALLAARIDRLDAREKDVLQTAAVIGRAFAEPLLAAVAGLPRAALPEALRALQAAEFVYQEALYPVAEYAFKHPLTQEVALASQLQDRRRRLHAAVASAIEAQGTQTLDEQAALLAHHWEEAHEPLTAARWHARAAAWMGMNDATQAARHWGRVRELVREVPEAPEAARLCATACHQILQLGWRLGLGEHECEAVYREGMRWAEGANDYDSRAWLEFAYASTFSLAGELERAEAHFLEHERLALDASSEELRVGARLGGVYSRMQRGRLADARARLDETIERSRDHPEYGRTYGLGLYVWCTWLRGVIESYGGSPEKAREMLDQAVRLARERDEVEIEGWALACYVVVAAFDGDLDGVVGKCRQSVEIAERLGSAISQQKGYLFLGRALVLNGQYEEGASLLEQSLAIARARRTGLEDEALNLAMLAAAHLGLGRLAPALAFAREATGTAQRRGTALTEIVAQIVLARVLAEQKGLDGAAEIRRVLERAEALVDETTARNWQPCVHIERARLAGFEENVAARARELREARRLFEIMPAPIRVREVDQLLAAVS